MSLTLLAVAACASVPAPDAPSPPAVSTAPGGVAEWWSVRIRMGFDGAESVAWHVDALLADRVFAPLVNRLGPALVLWRFHRRAAADEAGHQLSFIFYADRGIASKISAAIAASALIDSLRSQGVVEAVLMPGIESTGTDLAATSDRSWPQAIQRSWPHFIMGVSRHWLALIAQVRTEHPAPGSSTVAALIAHYRAINAHVDELWRVHAQHAYLHHLNALFGYQPLLMQEQRLIRF